VLTFLNKLGITVTRSRNVDPERRMNVILTRELPKVEAFIDVGANSGQTYYRVRSLGFKGLYVAIEPETTCYKILKAQIVNDALFSCLNFAVGESSADKILHIASNDSLSSSILELSDLHTKAAPSITMISTQSVRIETLSKLLMDVSAKSLLVKIDVQGYELPVLRGISENDWKRIEVLLLECNLVGTYQGSGLIEEVIAFLRKRGFHPYRIENGFGMPNFGQQLQVDVLFKRLTPEDNAD